MPRPKEQNTTLIPDQMLQDIRQALKSQKRSLIQKLSVLIISLLVFAGMGLLNGNPAYLLVLLLVLFIHESGHWLGMKIFGYTDVQMFFLPGFGAAVSGNETTPCAKQKAIVSLMGPLPGILIGIGLGIAYAFIRNSYLSYACAMFLLINGFNLLPFSPLDGGRFLEAVLFTRHPWVEVLSKILAVAGLAWAAFLWKSVALGIVAYLSLISIKSVWIAAKTAAKLRKELPTEHAYTSSEIPNDFLIRISSYLYNEQSLSQRTAKHLAATVKNIWSRGIIRHCSIRASLGLTFIYLLFAVPSLGMVAFFHMFMKNSATVAPSGDGEASSQTNQTDSVEIKWKPYKSEYPYETN